MTGALAATDWRGRERSLTGVYEMVAARHNLLGLTAPIDPRTRPFFGRPFQVLGADRFSSALMGAVKDDDIRALPLTGAIDQFADSTDFLGRGHLTRAVIDTVLGDRIS